MSLPVEKRRQWIKSRREQRKLTKYARLRRQLLRYLVLLSVLSLGVFVFYRINCHLYENKDGLIIKGNLVASSEQISSVLKSQVNETPLFMLNPSELESRVKNLSIVKYAFVRRYLLPKPLLTVEILEEFPWASIYCRPAIAINTKTPPSITASTNLPVTPSGNTRAQFVLAESGRLISVSQFPAVYQPALKIYIENPSQFKLSQNDIEYWANCLAYINKQTQCAVTVLDMREPHNIKVETNKFTIVLGNPDSGLTRRLNRLASVIEVLANQHKEPIYVNLALNSNIPIKLAKKSDKNSGDEKITQL